MRAVIVKSFGEPEAAEVAEVELPEPSAGQVRVKVHASGVHPADLLIRSGALAAMLPEAPHYALGWDLAGTVEALGEGVTSCAVGDLVIGLNDWFATMAGVNAEFAVLPAVALAPVPEGVSPSEAATLPLNGLTALQALDMIGVAEGQTLVVTGAAGGVGGFATELAVGRGAKVIAIAGSQDKEFVASLGAEFVERGDGAAEAVLALVPGGVDAVFDTALIGTPLMAAVHDDGVFVNVFPPAAPEADRGIRIDSIGVHSDGPQLAELSGMVEAGKLTLRLAGSYPAAEVAAVHTRLAAGGTRGGLVLTF